MSNKKLATILAACGAGALLFGIAASSGIAADKMVKVGDKEYPLKKVDDLSDFADKVFAGCGLTIDFQAKCQQSL